MHLSVFRVRPYLLLLTVVGGILVAAVAVSCWRVYNGWSDSLGVWLSGAAVVAGFSGAVVWRVNSTPVATDTRTPCQRQATALLVSASGVAIAVIVGGPYYAWITTTTCVVVMAVLADALMRIPENVSHSAARVRRALDGLFISGCVLFTFWVLWAPAGQGTHLLSEHYLVGAAIVAAVSMVGIGVVEIVRATTHRRRYAAVVTSLSLLAASHAGIVVIAVMYAPHWMSRAIVASWGLCCAGAAVLAWSSRCFPGARSAVPLPRVEAVVTLGPACVASSAALYHGFQYGPLGVDVIIMAMVVVASLSIRQVLARVDVRRYAEELASREAYFRSIVAGSSDITTVLDGDLRIRFQAAAATWRSHTDGSELVAMPFSEMVHPDDASTVERQLHDLLDGPGGRRVRVDARIQDSEGKWRDTESVVADQRETPHVAGLVVHTRDVAERRSLERELAKLAYTDPLTTLSNRRALVRTLESDVIGGTMPCTLLAIDLDGFKNVNDSQGHDIGDAVLVEMARRLKNSLRPTDVAARLGGDEFAVLLWCCPEDGYEIAERLLEHLSEPYRFDGRAAVFVSTSIGLAGCETADDVQALLRNADLALRSAKQEGKNKIEAYDASFEKKVRRRNTLEHELHGAIERGELALVYQPVISLPHHRVVGAEALIRWNHPRLGAVSPGEFIPIVEDAGQSHILASWTVRQVASRLAAWKAGGHHAWISMNLSPRQLHSRQFATDLNESLFDRGVPPHRLVVEITEQEVAQDADVLAAQLVAIRGTGVRIALDDFGAGYSSLRQLHRLPVDILKIDRDLVAGSDDGAAPLADIVVRLGQRLGLDVIAEGVETRSQLDVVANAGCGMVQGYLLARPMTADNVDALLREELYHSTPLAIES